MRRIEKVAVGALGVVTILGLASCGNFDPVATQQPITDPGQLYMNLTMDQPKAVNLSMAAPRNTFQLSATPRDALGNPIAGLPAPTFRSADPGAVTVTPDGVITAMQEGATNVAVIADLTTQGPVHHADTAYVNVITPGDPSARAVSVSIQPPTPEARVINIWTQNFLGSLVFFSGNATFPVLSPTILDNTGNPMFGLVVHYASLDPDTAVVDPLFGTIYGKVPGQARFVVSTVVYGTPLVDTATYAVIWPAEAEVTLGLDRFGNSAAIPQEVRIAPGGFVFWSDTTADSVDVTFDDTTHVAAAVQSLCDFGTGVFSQPADWCGDAGDLLAPPPQPSSFDPTMLQPILRVRQFPVAGTYSYHSTRTGLTGKIVVTSDPRGVPPP